MQLFEKLDLDLFKKIEPKSKDDVALWNLANLVFPLTTIFGSLLFFFFSDKCPSICRDGVCGSIITTLNFLLNGALPIIGINILVSSSFFLIRFDKKKEKDFGLETQNLRVRLILYAMFIYFFLSVVFALQTLYNPFNNITTQLFLCLLTVGGIYASISITNRLFMLQEEYIDKSYDKQVNKTVDKLKEAIG